jgi:hypothetical protein
VAGDVGLMSMPASKGFVQEDTLSFSLISVLVEFKMLQAVYVFKEKNHNQQKVKIASTKTCSTFFHVLAAII